MRIVTIAFVRPFSASSFRLPAGRRPRRRSGRARRRRCAGTARGTSPAGGARRRDQTALAIGDADRLARRRRAPATWSAAHRISRFEKCLDRLAGRRAVRTGRMAGAAVDRAPAPAGGDARAISATAHGQERRRRHADHPGRVHTSCLLVERHGGATAGKVRGRGRGPEEPSIRRASPSTRSPNSRIGTASDVDAAARSASTRRDRGRGTPRRPGSDGAPRSR